MTTPDLSVCVATYRPRRPPNLGTLADSIPGALGGRTAELVVVLNGIPAEEAGAPADATLVELPANRGVAAGWNAAVPASSGEVLVFANDDLVLGQGALGRLAAALEELPAAGVVGPRPLIRDERPARAAAGGLRATSCASLHGFLFAVRRDVYEQVGGFDEAFTPCLFEEVDFCYGVRQLGLNCYALEGVRHRHRFNVSARRSWPWARISYDGRSESLWSIRRRHQRLLKRKWPDAASGTA